MMIRTPAPQGGQRAPRRPRVDPTAWANRRKEAMERAKTSRRVDSSGMTELHGRASASAPAPPSSAASAHRYHHHHHRRHHERPVVHGDDDDDVPPSRSSANSYANSGRSDGGSVQRYAESHLQRRRRMDDPSHRIEGRGRGRGRGRRASTSGGVNDGLGYQHDSYGGRGYRMHESNDGLERTTTDRSSRDALQQPAEPSNASIIHHTEAGNKLSLLKQRMLERKKHRRRTLGSSGKNNLMPGEDLSQMRTYRRDADVAPEKSRNIRGGSANGLYSNDNNNKSSFGQQGIRPPPSPASSHANAKYHHQSQHRTDSYDAYAFGGGIHPSRPVKQAINHDEQTVGPARASRNHRNHNHHQQHHRHQNKHLNWDEQPVGPSRQKCVDVDVDPYMYDNRLYDDAHHSSPFSSKQPPRSYVWDEDVEEAGPDREQQKTQQQLATAAPDDSNPTTGPSMTTKASRLMTWDEQPVGQKVPMGPQEDDDSQVNLTMTYCKSCDKSFAPPTYKKLCAALDHNGVPRCVGMYNNKRKVYNSAKTRIKNNANLNEDEQRMVIAGRKRVVTEMKAKKSGKKKKGKNKSSKWKEESRQFREAMRANREWSKQGL